MLNYMRDKPYLMCTINCKEIPQCPLEIREIDT